MSASLCNSMRTMSLASCSRPATQLSSSTSAFVGSQLSAAQPCRLQPMRGSLVVVAAQNAKKRIRVAERHRQYNKPRRSAVATRMRKFLKALADLKEVKSEDELTPLQPLLNEAYEEIDKAIVKGILKKNTGSRRKSRLAKARQRLLVSSGLYTPATSS